MAIVNPKITLSRWYPWEQRNKFADMDKRGVYVIARFDDMPRGKALHLEVNVIYIGQTHGKKTSLRGRLGLFNRSARNGKSKHSGGRTYYKKRMDPEFPDVYFAVFPCELSEQGELPEQEINTAWIYHIERKLIWEYVSKHRHLPECNSQ